MSFYVMYKRKVPQPVELLPCTGLIIYSEISNNSVKYDK